MNLRELAVAAAMAGTILAACAPQTPPVLSMSDDATATAASDRPATISEATDRALDRVRPEPRPEVR